MILKSLILTTGLISSAAVVSNVSTNLTQSSIKKEINYDIFKTSQEKNDFSKQQLDWVAQAVKVHQEIHKQNMNLHNQKEYVTGFDKVEVDYSTMLALKVWVTKAYLGNVATIIGVAGGGVVLVVAVIAFIMTLYGVSAFITGGVGGIVIPIIAALYGVATAIVMNHVNSYEVGGFFKADFTLIATPITITSTIREQNKYESAPRLKKLDPKIKFGNKDSYDFLEFDKSSGTTRSFWEINQEDKEPFVGVLDISKYTRYLNALHVKSIKGSFGLRSVQDEIINVHNEAFETFLNKYYNDKSNDYLFIILKKISKNQYQLRVGGSKYSGNKELNHEWMHREINFEGNPHDLAVDLQLEIGKN